MSLSPGDRVTTATGQVGTVVAPPWPMPYHELVALDGGPPVWLLKTALTPGELAQVPTRRRRKKDAAA